MTYSDTPLGNQRISTTQPLIRNNFQFLQNDFRQDHVFNANVPGQQEGTHQKMSLGAIADPSSLPTGCNAIAYLANDNQLKLYRGPGVQTRNLSVYSISAAVNFRCGSPPTIVSSYNVASIDRNGDGLYTINFTNALAFNDYIVQVTCMAPGNSNRSNGGIQSNNTYGNSVSTNFVKVFCTNSANNFADALNMSVIIFGGQ